MARKKMFKDGSARLRKECEDALDLYTFEEILNENYIEEDEALFLLVLSGHLRLPEVNKLRFEDDE